MKKAIYQTQNYMDLNSREIRKYNNREFLHFFVLGITLLGIIFLFYTLQKSIAKQNEIDQYYSHLLDSIKVYLHEAEIYEGKDISQIIISDLQNKKILMGKLLENSSFSLVFIEPPMPCSSCLDQAITHWIEFCNRNSSANKVNIYFISERNNRHILSVAVNHGFENNVYFLEEGGVYHKFQIPPARTVSLFFAKSSKVIYAEYVQVTMMQRFLTLLEKIQRTIQ